MGQAACVKRRPPDIPIPGGWEHRDGRDDGEHGGNHDGDAARSPPLTSAARTVADPAGDLVVPFAIDPAFRTKLLNGWDDLDLTAGHAEAIAAFAERRARARPRTRSRTQEGTQEGR